MRGTRTTIEVKRDDRALLARFVEDRDERAFSELVARHGRMALGVCRRILGDSTEADDAFQATFLVLIARAEELHRGQDGIRSLGGWLHRVATNAALQARRESKSRRRRESAFAKARSDQPGDTSLREILPILDEEVRRLPDRYRAPLVLCYFQDHSQQGAADELGISYATLRRRLDHARELLRGRLARRGCSIAPAVVAAVLWDSAASADELGPDVSEALAGPLLDSSSPSGAIAVSSRSVRISQGVIRMIRNQAIRRSAGFVLTILLLLGSTGLVARVGLADDEAQAKTGAGKVGGTVSGEVGSVPKRPGAPTASPDQPASTRPQTPPPQEAQSPSTKPEAPEPKTEQPGDPKIAHENQEAIPRSPSGSPGQEPANPQSRQTFQGMVTINGQSRRFDNSKEFEKAIQGSGDPGAAREARPASKKAATPKKRRAANRAGAGGAGGAGGVPGFGFQGFSGGGAWGIGGYGFMGANSRQGSFEFRKTWGMPGQPGGMGRIPARERVGGGVDGFENAVGGSAEKSPGSAKPSTVKGAGQPKEKGPGGAPGRPSS